MRVLMLGWDFSPRLSGGVGSACQGLANALARAPAPLAAEVLFVLPRLRGDEEPEQVQLLSGDGRRAGPEPEATGSASVPGSASSSGNASDNASAAATASTVAPGTAATAIVAAPLVLPRSEPTRKEPRAAEPTVESRPEPTATPLTPAPRLPTPGEALRLLAIDSPLRPYLSPADYAESVRALLARIQAPAQQVRLERQAAPAARLVARAPAAATAKAEPAPALPAPSGRPATSTIEAPRDTRKTLEPSAAPEQPARVPPYGRTLSSEVERYAREVLALTHAEHFDVIHAHDWMTFPAALLLQERTGKPLVVHFHSSEAERRAQDPSPEARAIEQAAIVAAERVVCVSEAGASALRASYQVEYARLRVVHNAYSPLTTVAPEERRPGPTVLYLGRLSEQKSPDVFLRAAALVLARHRDAHFVLAGEGELYPELVALGAELGLGKHVEFTGFVAREDLARTYAAADVYVLSSAAEPFGISALEALSLGIPTIVSRGSGVTEVVRNVLRFHAGDVPELADKIVALLERPALRSQLSAAGLREVKKLRWDRPARALRAIYDEVARSAS